MGAAGAECDQKRAAGRRCRPLIETANSKWPSLCGNKSDGDSDDDDDDDDDGSSCLQQQQQQQRGAAPDDDKEKRAPLSTMSPEVFVADVSIVLTASLPALRSRLEEDFRYEWNRLLSLVAERVTFTFLFLLFGAAVERAAVATDSDGDGDTKNNNNDFDEDDADGLLGRKTGSRRSLLSDGFLRRIVESCRRMKSEVQHIVVSDGELENEIDGNGDEGRCSVLPPPPCITFLSWLADTALLLKCPAEDIVNADELSFWIVIGGSATITTCKTWLMLQLAF